MPTISFTKHNLTPKMPSLSWVLAFAVVAPVVAQDAALQTWELALIIGGGVVTALLVSYALYLCLCRSPPARETPKEKRKDVEMGKYPAVLKSEPGKPASGRPNAPGKPEAPLSIPDGIGKGKAGVYAKDPPKPTGTVATIANGTAKVGGAIANGATTSAMAVRTGAGKAGSAAANAAASGGKAAASVAKTAVSGAKTVVKAAVGGDPDPPTATES